MNKTQTLQAMRDVLTLKRRSPKTAKVYLYWVERFIDFLPRCSPTDSREQRIGKFLTMLASRESVAASTQKQALCALIFLYKNTLRVEVADLSFLRSNRPQRLPEVFSREEAWAVLDHLDGEAWLWGALMYGCGLRLFEVCQLRVKDLSVERRTLMVRSGKGDKDRMLPLPEMLVPPLEKHLRKIRLDYERHAGNGVAVSLPGALERKYPDAPLSWSWFWLFPASAAARDPKWRGRLHHIHDTAVQKRIRRGIRAARVPRPAGCHTFRHSFATHWLENAEGSHEVALKRLQELMGHKDVRTTMVYLHLLARVTVASPLDTRRIAAT
jgi:integron integrase